MAILSYTFAKLPKYCEINFIINIDYVNSISAAWAMDYNNPFLLLTRELSSI